MNRTHAVWLRQGVLRDDTANNNTMHLSAALGAHGPGGAGLDVPASPRSFHQRFLDHYHHIHELCSRASSPSLALVAIDDTGVAASALLTPPLDRCTGAIVGRHSMAELYLPGDPTLSLRHLAVIVHPPRRAADELRFRLVDLRTGSAFLDEHDRRLEAFSAEGPVFISCARFALYLLPTGPDLPWPENARDAWDCIPERVYLQERPAEPDRWERQRLRPRPTHVQSLRGPILAEQQLLAPGEQPLAELWLASSLGSGTIEVGHSALQQGVLLGRAPRCDGQALGVLARPHISRVHLLVLELEGEIYAIDTASTHGLWRGERRVRVARISSGDQLRLDTLGTRLEWRAVNHQRPFN